MDKFLLANNPLRDNDELFIIHCLYPIFLIRVVKMDDLLDKMYEDGDGSAICAIPAVMGTNSMHQQYVRRAAERWLLVPVLIGTTIEPFTQEYNDLGQIAKRAVRWFRTYRTQNPKGHEVDPAGYRKTDQGRKS